MSATAAAFLESSHGSPFSKVARVMWLRRNGRGAMKIQRRQFLQVVSAAAVASAFPQIASALDYPTRPVHFVVGFPAGGTTDIAARLIGQWLSERFGQPFIIENRPGATGNIATEAVVRAPSDGYTLSSHHCGERNQRGAL
jgi:tripartite-type tricarboxylate transporter receptor subunit TctC